jgi:hypothetical protein
VDEGAAAVVDGDPEEDESVLEEAGELSVVDSEGEEASVTDGLDPLVDATESCGAADVTQARARREKHCLNCMMVLVKDGLVQLYDILLFSGQEKDGQRR